MKDHVFMSITCSTDDHYLVSILHAEKVGCVSVRTRTGQKDFEDSPWIVRLLDRIQPVMSSPHFHRRNITEGLDLKHPLFCGYMFKQSHIHKAFNKRFFVLFPKLLIYYTNKHEYEKDVQRSTLEVRHAFNMGRYSVCMGQE